MSNLPGDYRLLAQVDYERMPSFATVVFGLATQASISADTRFERWIEQIRLYEPYLRTFSRELAGTSMGRKADYLLAFLDGNAE